MIKYILDAESGSLITEPPEDNENPFFAVMSTAELRECGESVPYRKDILHSLGSIRYCKADAFKDCVVGTLRIPQKSSEHSPQLTFGFYLTAGSLLFIEDEGELKPWVEKHINTLRSVTTPDRLLLYFLEQMTENDVLYLSHIEAETDKMRRKFPAAPMRIFSFHLQNTGGKCRNSTRIMSSLRT